MSNKTHGSISFSVRSILLLSLLLFLLPPWPLCGQNVLSPQHPTLSILGHQLVSPANAHAAALGITAGSAFAAAQTSVEPMLAIDPGGYVLVSSTRVNRTTFTYTFRATVVNSGADAFNVVGTIDAAAPSIQIVSDMVAFGSVPAGGRVLSTGTFTVKMDRTTPVTSGALQWSFAYHGAVTRELESSSTASATISGGGGSITTTSSSGIGFTLDAPRGSLDAPTTISATPVTGYTGIEGLGPLLAAVHLEPSGTLFLPAATLRMSGITFDPTNTSVYAISDDGKSAQLVPFTVSGRDLVVSVSHFTDYAAIAQSVVTIYWCSVNLTNPDVYYDSFLTTVSGSGILPEEDRSKTVFAVLEQWMLKCNRYGESDGTPSPTDIATLFVQEMDHWYYATPNGVAAELNEAAATSDLLEPWTINQFWDWMWEVEHDEFFVDMLEFLPDEAILRPIEQDGMGRLVPAIENQEQVAEQVCVQNPEVGDEITWGYINQASYFEFSYEAQDADDPWGAIIDLTQKLFNRKNCGGVGLVYNPSEIAMSVLDTYNPTLQRIGRDGKPADMKDPVPLEFAIAPSSVATVDQWGETVTAQAAGNATLEATQPLSSGVALFDAEAHISVRDLTIDVEPVLLTLQVGETATLTATPNSGQTSSCTYQWYSNSVGVVDVTAQGANGASAVVTAKAVGEALISAVCGSGIGKARVVTYGSITLSPQVGCIAIGGTLPLTVMANGTPVTQSATWSATPKIVSINGGLMTGLAAGTTTVVAKVGTLTSAATFTVTPIPICGTWAVVDHDVETTPGSGDWYVSETYTVTATGTPNTYNVAEAGYGSMDVTLVNNSFTFSDITWDAKLSAWDCATNDVTVNNDGTLQGTATWSEYNYSGGVCTGNPIMQGVSTFTGQLH